MSKSYVYFITDGRYVKIGKANSIRERLATLQTGSPLPLILSYALECTTGQEACIIEKHYHSKFGTYRMCGEWFDLPVGLLGSIQEIVDPEHHELVVDNVTVRHPTKQLANNIPDASNAKIAVKKATPPQTTKLGEETQRDRILSIYANREYRFGVQRTIGAYRMYLELKGTPNRISQEEAASKFGVHRNSLIIAKKVHNLAGGEILESLFQGVAVELPIGKDGEMIFTLNLKKGC